MSYKPLYNKLEFKIPISRRKKKTRELKYANFKIEVTLCTLRAIITLTICENVARVSQRIPILMVLLLCQLHGPFTSNTCRN